jgi:2-hydroxy-3-keto-5-methylthiopentenyl-1-phosphate phosphatase
MTEPVVKTPLSLPTPAPLVPPADSAQVWIDFDGTLSRRDVLDDLIRNFAVNESWKMIEEQWQAGQIGSRQCLERQLGLVNVGDEELAEYLDAVELDPGAIALLKLLKKFHVPVAVLSDGIDLFIKRILKNNGVSHLPVRSNTIERTGERMKVICPHSSASCTSASAHCKCSSASALGRAGRGTIYIGDGRSDLCAARGADYVFAKNALARFLTQEGKAFTPFATLEDVRRVLSQNWRGASHVHAVLRTV